MILHHVRTSLFVFTPILLSFYTYFDITTLDFSQPTPKLNKRNPFPRKFAWNGVVNGLGLLGAPGPPRRHKHGMSISWLHRSTSEEEKEVEPFRLVSNKPMTLSPLIFCSVFAPKQHFTYAWPK